MKQILDFQINLRFSIAICTNSSVNEYHFTFSIEIPTELTHFLSAFWILKYLLACGLWTLLLCWALPLLPTWNRDATNDTNAGRRAKHYRVERLPGGEDFQKVVYHSTKIPDGGSFSPQWSGLSDTLHLRAPGHFPHTIDFPEHHHPQRF